MHTLAKKAKIFVKHWSVHVSSQTKLFSTGEGFSPTLSSSLCAVPHEVGRKRERQRHNVKVSIAREQMTVLQFVAS